MSDTENRILNSAERLIQSRGYSAISYQDISNEVGIRKASIHYYFPSKADLVTAVVKRYRENVKDLREASIERRGNDVWGLLEDYVAMYLVLEAEPNMICLCGALAGEFPVLPVGAKSQVQQFFADNLDWLRIIVKKGLDSGQFQSRDSVGFVAGWVISVLQGALIVGRATDTFELVHDASAMVRRGLEPVRVDA